MALAKWEESDSAKAKQIWIDYQRQHDLSARIGQTAGIDPRSGRHLVWCVGSRHRLPKRGRGVAFSAIL